MIKFIIKLLLLNEGGFFRRAGNGGKGMCMNQNGYHPSGMQEYGRQQGGYAPYGTTPTGQQNGGANMAPPAAPMSGGPMGGTPAGNPYAMPPAGYTAPGSYTMPPQQGNGGSFIPQTPYSPGYTSPGYQPPAGNGYPPQQQGYLPQGYPQAQPGYPQGQPGYPQAPMAGYQAPQGGTYTGGYSPYAQMGRAPQAPGQPMQGEYSPNNPIPLNGGGYIPPKVPVRKHGFEFREWHLLALSGILIALFILAVLILRSPALKIILMIAAAGSAGFLWIKPLVAENRRLTYTIVALSLCVLTAVSFLIKAPQDNTKNKNQSQQPASAANTQAPVQGGVPEIPAADPLKEENTEPAVADNTLMERLIYFFKLWSENRQDEMLTLCAPSWTGKQENPRTSLFNTLANRFPVNFRAESITGTDADSSRQVTVTTEIDRRNNKPRVKYRMTVLMVKENGEWYVDPKSLQTNDIEETPDPNITPTPAPTPTAAVYDNTVLYYNPKGGKYYHAVPDCKNVGAKYLPLAGTFYYSQLNDADFKDLQPCNVCGAPLRP